jgi:hypothetical protein
MAARAILICAIVVVGLAISKELQPVCHGLSFGDVDGVAADVPAYSNCNCSFTSNENAYVNTTFSGMKWQCVEYGRRFLILRFGVTFGSVVGADDIWDLPHATLLATGRKVPFQQYANDGTATNAPQVGALFIYPKQHECPFGHVAAVVEVTLESVRIGEQNWNNKRWVHANYSRELPLRWHTAANGVRSVMVNDPEGYTIVGWKMPVE